MISFDINYNVHLDEEMLLLTDKVDRAGSMLSDISTELCDHDRRLVRLETIVEIVRNQPRITE